MRRYWVAEPEKLTKQLTEMEMGPFVDREEALTYMDAALAGETKMLIYCKRLLATLEQAEKDVAREKKRVWLLMCEAHWFDEREQTLIDAITGGHCDYELTLRDLLEQLDDEREKVKDLIYQLKEERKNNGK